MKLEDYLDDPNVRAFLRAIRAGESNQSDDAYTMRFGGSHFAAPPWQHPGPVPITANGYTSTAAGAYQFLWRTWDEIATKWAFPDFSPDCQDMGAVVLLIQCGAMPFVIAGDLQTACDKAGKIWASLPGSPYGQPTIPLSKVESVFRQYGGMPAGVSRETISQKSPVLDAPKGKQMAAPLLLALAPMLAELIPQIAKLFSSGSEVATRNTAAVEAVAATVVKATNSANVQEAIERMQADPVVRQTATEAVVTDPVIIGMLEIGGGIQAAREANLAAQNAEKSFLHNPAFWISLIFIAMPFMLLADVLYVHPDSYSENIRTQIVTAVLGVIMVVGGYWLGSSMGSQKKTDALTRQ